MKTWSTLLDESNRRLNHRERQQVKRLVARFTALVEQHEAAMNRNKFHTADRRAVDNLDRGLKDVLREVDRLRLRRAWTVAALRAVPDVRGEWELEESA